MKKEKWKIDQLFLIRCAEVFGELSEDDKRYYSVRPFGFLKGCLEADRKWPHLPIFKGSRCSN